MGSNYTTAIFSTEPRFLYWTADSHLLKSEVSAKVIGAAKLFVDYSRVNIYTWTFHWRFSRCFFAWGSLVAEEKLFQPVRGFVFVNVLLWTRHRIFISATIIVKLLIVLTIWRSIRWGTYSQNVHESSAGFWSYICTHNLMILLTSYRGYCSIPHVTFLQIYRYLGMQDTW